MKKTIESINQVLAQWDPIGVGIDTATDEYRSYISLILKSSESKYKLMNCLEDIAIKMEMEILLYKQVFPFYKSPT